ncbi:MAG: hypothetical protein AABX11_01515 [Nanoarchaeota archaeon]
MKHQVVEELIRRQNSQRGLGLEEESNRAYRDRVQQILKDAECLDDSGRPVPPFVMSQLYFDSRPVEFTTGSSGLPTIRLPNY